ncbi:hypothetical protein PM10SUCC1_32340 [Propionigenium maris DSM 9537]|uniref:Uncharacterized protein n=1 Tax=Propionigenium maris DSM 9537 TaxID=1123000 RepID=A0A9W6GPD7_9FUSO|nr:hypothetical protein [Propionigenium maris]GLI57720.1 hypothetical protein PM10SUCC1_32340 [Propionigenium maris DSM 9537]
MKKFLKVLKWIGIFYACIILVGVVLSAVSRPALLKHKVLTEEILKSGKYSADIEVYTKDGKFPGPKELQRLAQDYKEKNYKNKNYFIHFYLPGMKVGSGAYAVANNAGNSNPNMEVEILTMMLSETQYEKYIENYNLFIEPEKLPFYTK